MNIRLDEFEQQIDPKIVGRGYDYFVSDLVNGPELVDEDLWQATVYGSCTYNVKIYTDPGNHRQITDWHCTCPYEFGSICKHVVATLYALVQQVDLEEKVVPTPAGSQAGPTSKSNIQTILNNTTKQDLEAFIRTSFKNVEGLKNLFLAYFADRLDGDPKQKYRTIIHNCIRTAQGPYGFIDYQSAPTLIGLLYKLLQKTGNFLEDENVHECLAICQTIIEEIADVIQDMDDSDGYGGELLMKAFQRLDELAECSSSDLKEELFYWCMTEFPKNKYHNTGFYTDFLHLLPQLITSREQEEQFFNLLDQQIEREKQKRWSDYGDVQLIKAKITYLERQGRDNEIHTLIKQHRQYPDFRERLVDLAVENNDLERAKALCREGIEIAKGKNHHGTVSTWHKKLFELAKQEDNVPEVRHWSETLFYNGGDMKWYRALKSTYPEQKWTTKCQEIIGRLKTSNLSIYSRNDTTLAQIFVEERYLDRLLKLVQQHSDHISFVDCYSDVLAEEYPYELLDLYEEGITERAKPTGRKYYREVAGWLKKMKTFKGGDERAYALYKQFFREYNNRPAMKEELSKAFPKW